MAARRAAGDPDGEDDDLRVDLGRLNRRAELQLDACLRVPLGEEGADLRAEHPLQRGRREVEQRHRAAELECR
jgi:hypothetical protein